MKCLKCNAEIVIGSYPFCNGSPEDHAPRTPAIRDDSWPGGKWFHNLGPKPLKLYSETERRAVMAERGLVEHVKHVPVPGSDKSPHTTNWAGPSPHTLATLGDWLAARSSGHKPEPEPPPVEEPVDAGWLEMPEDAPLMIPTARD